MKVLCIDGVKAGSLSVLYKMPASPSDEIFENESYTVVREFVIGGNPAYDLAERSRFSYKQSRFIPLSSICEKEIVKERESELVTS